MNIPSPFYEEVAPERSLRLGDVVSGFYTAALHIDEPSRNLENNLSVAVKRPQFSVVMTPCCSIEKKSIALAPLLPILPSFLTNPYFNEDLTRINRRVPPQKSVPPKKWEELPQERKDRLLNEGEAYTFLQVFVYAPHNLLGQYTLDRQGGNVSVAHYMIDFKWICRLECDLVDRNSDRLADLKVLQLTAHTRADLREKLSFFFGRVPDEDKAQLI